MVYLVRFQKSPRESILLCILSISESISSAMLTAKQPLFSNQSASHKKRFSVITLAPLIYHLQQKQKHGL